MLLFSLSVIYIWSHSPEDFVVGFGRTMFESEFNKTFIYKKDKEKKEETETCEVALPCIDSEDEIVF